MTDIENAVRAWARGLQPLEAGAELLIRQGKAVYDGAPWLVEHSDGAAIDVDTLLYESGVWSGSEQRIVHIAASLLDGRAVDLNGDIPGLDTRNLALVLAAIAHAGGISSMHPWPT